MGPVMNLNAKIYKKKTIITISPVKEITAPSSIHNHTHNNSRVGFNVCVILSRYIIYL